MAFFFLKILVDLKYRPLNLVSYHFGSLTLHSATYSSLINFNHERRVRFSILTSQCHGQLYTESFCFSTPKATACVRHLTVPSWCPSVPDFGLSSPWSTLPGTEQSLQPVFPPCAMWGQAGQRQGGLLGSPGRRSTALLCHTHGTLWLSETCSNPPDFILLMQGWDKGVFVCIQNHGYSL